jgi:hypothetical protein
MLRGSRGRAPMPRVKAKRNVGNDGGGKFDNYEARLGCRADVPRMSRGCPADVPFHRP